MHTSALGYDRRQTNCARGRRRTGADERHTGIAYETTDVCRECRRIVWRRRGCRCLSGTLGRMVIWVEWVELGGCVDPVLEPERPGKERLRNKSCTKCAARLCIGQQIQLRDNTVDTTHGAYRLGPAAAMADQQPGDHFESGSVISCSRNISTHNQARNRER